MPSLGFLKKKRTRDGNGDNPPSAPTSPVAPTAPRSFEPSQPRDPSLSSFPLPPTAAPHAAPHSPPNPQPASNTSAPPPAQDTTQMAHLATQPAFSQQPSHDQQNLPSISNLIGQNHQQQQQQQPSQPQQHAAPAEQAAQYLTQPNARVATVSPGTDPEKLAQEQANAGMAVPGQLPSAEAPQPQVSHQAGEAAPLLSQGLPHGGLAAAEYNGQQAQGQGQVQAQAQAQGRITKGKYALQDFEILRTLGTGSFGRVHLVQSRHNTRFYAIKVLKKAQVVKMKQVEHTNDERKMLAEVKHPFLITLWGTFQDSKNLYMVMDFVEGGELFSLLRKSGRFPNPVAKFYAAEVTLALEYMHSKNIIYRDLKPENLLLDRHGHLKITDFGFAKRVPDKTWTLCGTPDYLAPEVVSNKGYNKSVDWWSLGILIYEMLCGYTPFWDGGSPMKIYENILRGKVKYPEYMHPDARDLLERLVTADITKRLGNLYHGSADVKNHPWFSEVTWERLARKDIDAPYTPPVKAGVGDTSLFDRYPEETEQYGQTGPDE
ncbi:probable cAMP-dependent protein kinase [Cephalotrichum gorgonifer]|uniref:cAMP-dependent protein kinase n=1 Tax=Cephalotrichum gorgonifer TaxID=2041049 RepID=A0AAE8SU05_9PEZI|nr:probable cAMP-dependent protein kinase [Cephalotrichum gorgonifer]